MTHATQSRPNGGFFMSTLAVLITMVFLATAVVLWCDPWGHAAPLPTIKSVDPERMHPVLVRTSPQRIHYYGSENCEDCHSKREYRKLWGDWTKGGHKDVECEACHGPAGDHALPDVEPRPKMLVTEQLLAKPQALCMGCHTKRPGREAPIRQIDLEKHLADWKVNKGDPEYEQAAQCLSCHDPHRPVKK